MGKGLKCAAVRAIGKAKQDARDDRRIDAPANDGPQSPARVSSSASQSSSALARMARV
jgi:hypothetical protein